MPSPRAEFTILGPFEARVGSQSVHLAGQKQRALLAMLLLHANEVVSTDRLVAGIWDGDGPETAPNVVQVYVSQIRKALAAAGSAEQLVVTRAPGYMLRIDSDQLDANRFEALAARGREALRSGDAAAAVSLLDEALALWHGEPLVEFAYAEFAQTDRRRLEELGQAVAEDRLRARLELGEGPELVAELGALAAAHPEHEQLRAQLALALYRSGRQADALDELRRARRELSEQLGLEPGPELRELERAILRHDPALAGAAAFQARVPPASPASLLGRERELDEVVELLCRPEVRLLTLTGPGGIGKTRLAIAAAREAESAFADGAALVDLSPITRPSLVAPTIAQAVGVGSAPGIAAAQALEQALAERELLLVLDNFEQLLPAVPLLAVLLAGAPSLTALVTSRSTLRVSGEHEFPVSSLELPRAGDGRDERLRAPAVQLFVERAAAARRGFAPSNDDVEAIAEICARLDGLPLAIELAAARVKLLDPPAILQRLDSALDLLSGGARDLPPRQRALRTTLDWSRDLLEPDDRILFARLAVFVGGCTLSSASRVCGIGSAEIVDRISSLVENNLVISAGERLRMLETVRAYALEQLEASREAETVRRRHLEHAVELAEQAERTLEGPEQRQWLQALDREHDNLRAAFSFALAAGDRERALRLCGSLRRFWQIRGHLHEGRRALEAALARREPVAPLVLAKALNGDGVLAGEQGDFAGAEASFERALEAAREAENLDLVASALTNLGTLALFREDFAGAAARYEEAASICEAVGNRALLAATLENLGCVAFCRGEYDRAVELLEQAETLARETGHEHNVASSLRALGRTLLVVGDLERAADRLAESLAIAHDLGQQHGLADALEAVGGLAAARGDGSTAASMFGAGARIREEIGARRAPDNQAWFEHFDSAARALLDSDAFESAEAQGRELDVEQAFALAQTVAEE